MTNIPERPLDWSHLHPASACDASQRHAAPRPLDYDSVDWGVLQRPVLTTKGWLVPGSINRQTKYDGGHP